MVQYDVISIINRRMDTQDYDSKWLVLLVVNQNWDEM